MSSDVQAIVERRFPAISGRLDLPEPTIRTEHMANRSKDWDRLLSRWLEGISLDSGVAYALTGFGDGSHVAALLDQLPKGSYVFCAEPDADCFYSESIDSRVSNILEDPRLFLGVGELNEDFFESLSRFPILELEDAQPLVFAPCDNERSAYFSSYFGAFAQAYEYWRKLYGTNVTASGRWQKNTFKNATVLISAPDLAELKGAMDGETIIMVSAGPSLDGSLEFVKRHSDRCVVVAVNSSFRALRNYGIRPHFVIAADPYEYTDQGFEGVSSADSILICPFIVYPKVVERFPGRILTWSQNNLLASYLRLMGGMPLGSGIVEMGTVSACVFDIATALGSRTIVFVGQDLAAKSDGQLHAEDSFYSDLKANFLKEESCRELPGNTMETVKVDEKLFVYLKAFESLAAERGNDLMLYFPQA